MILMLIVPTEVSLPLGLGYTEVPGLRNNRLCTQPVCMVEGCWKDAKSKEDTKVCASEESFWMKRSRSGGKHTGRPPLSGGLAPIQTLMKRSFVTPRSQQSCLPAGPTAEALRVSLGPWDPSSFWRSSQDVCVGGVPQTHICNSLILKSTTQEGVRRVVRDLRSISVFSDRHLFSILVYLQSRLEHKPVWTVTCFANLLWINSGLF